MKSYLSGLTTVLTILVLPLFFVRLLLVPAFPAIEYRMPGFPADNYGFSDEQRVHWATYGIEYLLNDAGPQFLGDLRFEDGSPVFSEAEVSHMLDVKIVVAATLRVFRISLVLLVSLGLFAWWRSEVDSFRLGISRGGWILLILLLTLGLLAATSFWQFFSAFHAIFFEGDSWLFALSDTLIRLYPIRFWQDVILYILGGSALAGGLLGWFLGKRPRAATSSQKRG
ncbi:MAG: TIGR01906 family membrane protein [Anaerolineales bacterium]|jgi:integral membrane protein (TIGR01906 family)|nr:TIGR01906 family membrane protein [Anaerolineales bacterium]